MQPKLLVRFGGLATRNPPAEEQEGRPGPTLHLIIPARCLNRTGFSGDSISWEIMESWED